MGDSPKENSGLLCVTPEILLLNKVKAVFLLNDCGCNQLFREALKVLYECEVQSLLHSNESL